MLYQLSYLGVSKGPRKKRRAIERAVYSGPKRRCLPRFAFGFARRSRTMGKVKRARRSPQGENGSARQDIAQSRLFRVLGVVLGARDHIGTGEPAVEVDI